MSEFLKQASYFTDQDTLFCNFVNICNTVLVYLRVVSLNLNLNTFYSILLPRFSVKLSFDPSLLKI